MIVLCKQVHAWFANSYVSIPVYDTLNFIEKMVCAGVQMLVEATGNCAAL